MTPPSRAPFPGPRSGRFALPGRRRAEELAAALDGQQAADAAVGGPVDRSPSGSAGGSVRGSGRDELHALVGVATALRSLTPVEPRPEHVTALRERLMEEAESLFSPEMQKLRVPPRPKGARERKLVAAAAAVLLIGGTASVATAAQDALPGQALYPIKRSIERAQTEIASSPAGKGRTLLGQAGDRLDEVSGLLDRSPVSDTEISGTLTDFRTEARDGATLLLGSFRSSGDRSSVTTVRFFAARSLQRLETMARQAPDSSRPAFAAAAVTLRNLDAQASSVCATCAAGLPALKVPQLLLVRAEVQQALQKAGSAPLDNSHPVVVSKGSHDDAPAAGAGSVVPAKPKATSGGGSVTVQTPAPAPPSPSPSPDQQTTPLPGSLPTLLPDPTPTSSDDSGLSGTVNGLTGTLDGLTGTATTLLPDPGQLLP
jgi:hypothetical protein